MAFIDEQKKLDAIAAAFKEFTGQTVKQGIATKANSNPVTSQPTVQAPTSDFSKQVKQFTAGPTVQLPMPTAQQTMQFQPAQQKNWYRGEMPTASEMLAQITRVGQQNYEQGLQMMELYNQLQNDKSSPFWAPYSKPTNLALTELAALGFDVSNGVDDKWFQDNAYLMNYYRESSASGGALAPTKKSSWEEKAAYWYNQALKDDENTKKAEQEWAALQEEIAYWTNRSDRNYSDDEILGKINWNNYKTLTKMDEAKSTGSPMMLNRAIGYNKDDLRGIIWAARNGSTGSTMLDSVQYELGNGKGWHENANVRGKLDVTNKETYSPYSVGSTLDDAALYFGVNDFSSDWCEKNRHLLASDNDTDRKMWQKVYEAEQNTKQAEAELAELMETIDNLKYDDANPEALVELVKGDLEKWPTLNKMDDSRESAKLMDTTRAVNYRWEDVEAEIRRRAEYQRQNSAVTLKKAYKRLNGATNINEHEPADLANKNSKISDAYTIIYNDATDAEKKVFKHAGASGFANYVNRMAEIVRTGMALPQTVYDAEKKQATDYAAQHLFDSRKTIDDYEAAQQQKNDAQQVIDSILEGMPSNVGATANPRFMGVLASAGVSERPMLSAPTPPEEDSDEGKALLMWMAQNRDRVQEINQQADWDDDKAWAMAWQEYQREQMPDPQESYIESLDPETRAQYYAAQKALEEADATIEKLQGSYEEAQGHMEQIGNRQDIAARMGALGGADMGEDQIEAMNQLYEIGKEYKPTVYSTETIFDALPEKERVSAAKKAVEEYTAELQRIDETMKALDGVQFSEGSNEIFNNVQRERERLQRELTAAQHYAMMDDKDFDKNAEAGRKALEDDMDNTTILDERTRKPIDLKSAVDPIYWAITKANGEYGFSAGDTNAKISLMSEDEKKIFYSLYNQNPQDALDWFNYLADDTYGVLTNREAKAQAESDEAFAQAFPVLANVTSILASPGKIVGGIYGFTQLLTGEDVNPNSKWYTLSRQSSTIKGTTQQQINEYFGDNTKAADVANFVYNALSSVGESTMNTLTFGALVPGGGNTLTKVLSEFLGATPMALGAAGDTISKAVADGATPEQALSIGAVTMLAEAGTEAITLGNMKEAFSKGINGVTTAKGFKGFMIDLAKDMGEEATGEMINEVVEYLADDKIMGELGERQTRINELIGQGMSPDNAEAKANEEFIGRVLETGLSAMLSAGITTGGGEIVGAISNNAETARISRNNMAILEESMQADTASQTEAVAATLATDGNVDASTAAAVEMMDAMGGEKSINAMKHIEAIAASNRMNLEEVHNAVRTAATGKGRSFTALRDIAEHGATPQKVQNLVASAEIDIANAEVQERMQQTEADIRAAGMVREQAANGAFDSVFAAQEETQKAKAKQRLAEKELNRMQQKAEQLGDAFMTMQDQYMQDPTNIKAEGAMIQAMNDLDGQNEVVHEYEQSLQNQQEATAMAERKYNRERDKAMGIARDLAEQQMAAEDEQRAVAAQAAEQAQAETRERQNAQTLDDDAFIDMAFPDATEEEKALVRERINEQRQGIQNPEAVAHRERFVRGISQKFGVNIEIVDTTAGGTQQRYNGSYNADTNTITIDQAASQSDMIYAVALHELTHMAERSGMYDKLATALTRAAYANGDGTFNENQLANDIRARQQMYNARLALMQETNPDIDATPLTEADAAKEIVADLTRRVLYGDESAINSLVATDESVARRFLNSIRNFLRRLAGIDDPSVVQLRKTQQLFEQALKDARDNIANKAALESDLQSSNGEETSYGDRKQFSLRVTDQDELAFLDNQEPITTYKTMQLIDGHLYPPMAAVVAGNKEDYSVLGQWEKATEHPELIKDGNKFTLNKGKGQGSLAAAYNPYMHSSNLMINDQFSGAYARPNLVTVECEVPSSEATSNYHAEYAKDTTGWHSWHTGVVASALRHAKGTERQVFLSRWIKPVRIVPDAEVAQHYADLLSGTDVVIPDNVVYPSLLEELKKLDVPIKESGRVQYSLPEDNHMLGTGEYRRMNEALGAGDQIDMPAPEREGTPDVTDGNGKVITREMPGGTATKEYSLASWTPEERSTVRQNLLNKGFAEADVDSWINDVDGVASIIAADKSRLDYTADPDQVMLKPNNDYVVTLDASTLCAKRLLYQGTFNEIQHLLPNTPLTPTDLIDLVNMMKDAGYESPCGICYVESRRRHLGEYAEEFIEKYEGDYKPTVDDLTSTDGLSKLKAEHPETYKAFIAAMNKKGTANPKVVQLRTDYRGDIRNLTEGDKVKVVSIGGLRVQSFSDFETPHLIDMMQAVLDMSAEGLTSQAYTKVPNFAWAFGDTGIKINLSLIGDGNGLDANGNLLFSSTEGMDFNEAMRLRDRYSENVGTILVGMNDDHILAAMADDRIDFIIPFHKSGWSKVELQNVRGMSAYEDYTSEQNERKIASPKEETHYSKTRESAEKWLKTKSWASRSEITERTDGKPGYVVKAMGYETIPAKEAKLTNFEPVGPNGYWDFSKSGKENAEAYLKLCAEQGRIPKFSRFLVDNGDGSFSLQPDGSTDGYWKTLIDFKMYNNEGVGAPQRAVTPNVNMDEAVRILNEYEGDANSLPVAQDIVDEYVNKYKAEHPREQYSLPSADIMDEMIRQYLSGNYGAFGRQLPATTNQPATQPQESTSGPVTSGQETIQNVTDALGITNDPRVKKYLRNRRKKTRGYTYNNDVIHVRDIQDTNAAVHEIGHNLDRRLGMESWVKDMDALAQKYHDEVDPEFLMLYDNEEVAGELMAEFTLVWSNDRAEAVNVYGSDFVNRYEQELKKNGWLKPMQDAAEQMRRWDNASSIERAESMVTLDLKKNQEKISLNKLRTNLADHTLPLQQITEALVKAGHKLDASNDTRTLALANPSMVANLTEANLYGQLTDAHGNSIKKNDGTEYGSLSDILHKVGAKNEKEFNTYLLARLELERGPVGKSLLNKDVDAQQTVQYYENKYPNFRDTAIELYDWFQAFEQNWWVGNGISQKQFDALRALYPSYIPLMAAGSKPSGGSKRTDADPSIKVKKAYKTDVNKYNPVMALVETVQKQIAAVKNIEMLRAFDAQMKQLYAEGLDVSGIAEPAQKDVKVESYQSANETAKQKISDLIDQLYGATPEHGMTTEAADKLLEALDNLPALGFKYTNATGNDVINIPMEDGSYSSWTVYDPEVLKALTMTKPGGRRYRVARAIAGLTRFLSANATSRSLKFSGQNVFSDVETIASTSKTGYNNMAKDIFMGARPVHMAKELWAGLNLLRNMAADTTLGQKFGMETSQAYEEFKKFGLMGNRYAFREGKSQRETRKALYGGHKSFGEAVLAVVKSPVNFVEALSNFGEEMSRFNTFAYSGFDLSTYDGKLAAGRASREGSVDFSKFGAAADSDAYRLATTGIAFLNAQIQGIDKTLDTLSEIKNDPYRRDVIVGRLAVNSLILGALTAGLRQVMWGDDEEEGYKDLTDYEKTKFVHLFRWPDGSWFKIKRSQDMFIQTADLVGEMAGELLSGYDGDALSDLANGMREVVKNGFISTDTVFQPMIDAVNGTNWYGGDNDTYTEKTMSKTARYGIETSKTARLISTLLGGAVSPNDADYAIKQYLGSVGTIGTTIFDTIASSVSNRRLDASYLLNWVKEDITKGFVVDPVYSNKMASAYYTGKENLDYIINEGEKGKAPELLRSNLTQEELNAAYAEAVALNSKEGAVYEAGKKYSKLKKEYNAVMDPESTLTPAQQEEEGRRLKHEMNMVMLDANTAMGDFFNKYGYSSGVEQAIYNSLNILSGDSMKNTPYLPNGWDSLSDTFKRDENEEYMKLSKSVYDASGAENALPHPDYTFSNKHVEYTVSAPERMAFDEVYKRTYETEVRKNSKGWDDMTADERLQVLKDAHTEAQKKAKAWFISK